MKENKPGNISECQTEEYYNEFVLPYKDKVDKFLEESKHPDFELIQKMVDDSLVKKNIPKIIHFSFMNNHDVKNEYYIMFNSWLEHLKGYIFINWHPDILKPLPYIEEFLKKKKYAFYADYARIYGVYNYGGIWMDSDVFVYKSFDDILDIPYFFDLEYSSIMKRSIDPRLRFETGVFGTTPKFDFIKKIKDYYESMPNDSLNLPELITPFLWNDVIALSGVKVNFLKFDNLSFYKNYVRTNTFIDGQEPEILSLDGTYFSKTNMHLPCKFDAGNKYYQTYGAFKNEEYAYTSHQFFSSWI